MKRRAYSIFIVLLIAVILCGCASDSKTPAPDKDSVNIYIVNNYSGTVGVMGISYIADGKVLQTGGTFHADKSAFTKGEVTHFTLPKESFDQSISCLTIEIYTGEEAGKDTRFCAKADITGPGIGESYFFELSGENGSCSLSETKPL